MVWMKPKHIPNGKVWHRFTGKVEGKNGKPLEYKVKDVSKELVEPCIEHLVKHFVPREPLLAHEGIVDNESALKELKTMWRKLLSHGVALVAIVDGEGDESIRIAGLNISFITEKYNKEEKHESDNLQTILTAVNKMHKVVNLFEAYGVDHYLTAIGLSVSAQYQGDSISHNIFIARGIMCETLGLKLLTTPFSNPAGVHEIEKEGYSVIYRWSPDELKTVFPRLQNPYLVLTAKVLEPLK